MKRLIGKKYADTTVYHDKKYMPFYIADKDNRPYIKTFVKNEEKAFFLEEISAMIIVKE